MLPRLVLVAAVSVSYTCDRSDSTTPERTTPAPATAATPASEAAARPDAPAVEPAAPTPTILGTWVGDPACVPEMDGMQGADAATIDAVGRQIAANRFVFTDDTMTHSVAGTDSAEPYRVVTHEGTSWTIEMKGPRGAPQLTRLEIAGARMRMTRDDALVMCLSRAE